MEEELNHNSVSNNEDAPNSEVSEESIAQESAPGENDDVAMEASENPGTRVEDAGDSMEAMQEETARGSAEEKEDDDIMEENKEEDEEKHFQNERKRKGKEKAIPLPKKRKISRPASRTVVIQEPSQGMHESSSLDSEEEVKPDSDHSYQPEDEDSEEDSITSMVESKEEQELISYEGMEVDLEKEDIEE